MMVGERMLEELRLLPRYVASVAARLLLTQVSALEVRGWFGRVDMMEILSIGLALISMQGMNVFRY